MNDPSNLELILRLFLAAVFGAVIGFQRELAGKPAGIRTDALICFGSALFAVVSIAGFEENGSVDASRIAAGVVTGIGFLGAGAIIRGHGGRVAGLTTAAGIWVVAAIGICVGAGLYLISTAATVIATLILLLPKFKD
jgi:putative Mg2+ transporter-C (MgtC) family protein